MPKLCLSIRDPEGAAKASHSGTAPRRRTGRAGMKPKFVIFGAALQDTFTGRCPRAGAMVADTSH